jgi:hypothetical protein
VLVVGKGIVCCRYSYISIPVEIFNALFSVQERSFSVSYYDRFRGLNLCVLISELIALMMEAVQSSEMLVNLYQFTLCYIPEDRRLHSHHWEDLKLYWSSPGLCYMQGTC